MAFAFLAVPTASQAFIGKAGLFHCHPTVERQVDPIGQFGVTPSDHLHVAAGANLTATGAQIFTATTRPQDQVAAGSTSSCVSWDHNLTWFPAPLQPNGQPATVKDLAYYILNSGYTVQRPPNGLRFIGGNRSYHGQFGAATYTGIGCTWFAHTIPPADPARTGGKLCSGYSMGIFGPSQCWIGSSLGQGMGGSTPPATFTADNPSSCVAKGGKQIPQVEFGMEVGADGVGGYLSSDRSVDPSVPGDGLGGESAHFDFSYGMLPDAGQDSLSKIVSECLNDPAYTSISRTSCGFVGSALYEDVPATGQPDWSDPDRVVLP